MQKLLKLTSCAAYLTLIVGCGETVNYDTQVKEANKSSAPANAGGVSSDVPSSDAVGVPGGTSGSGTAGDGTSSGTSTGTLSEADIERLCAGNFVQTKLQTLVFPELPAGQTCAFGQGDNLSKKDGFYRAYLKQTETVTLPAGALLCSLTIDHQSQSMRYDDEMYFSVNDKLLLGTKDYSELFPKKDLFETFSWGALKNQVYDSGAARGVYCVGQAEGLTSCSVPPTETQGNIQLVFNPEMNKKLAASLRQDQRLDFDWITTGDNDDSDCRHTEIDLGLTIRYVMP